MRFKAGLLLAFLPAVAWAVLQRPPAAAPAPTEAVAVLQQQINSGKVKLDFEEDRGYIRSVLNAFKIPVSSQGLVFGRNSFQLDLISPASPRCTGLVSARSPPRCVGSSCRFPRCRWLGPLDQRALELHRRAVIQC